MWMKEQELLNKLIQSDSYEGLIDQLKQETLPIVLWGIGSLAYSVKRLLKKSNIDLACCMVDGEFNVEEYEGVPVYSRSEVLVKYTEFVIVFGHSFYEKREEILKECPAVKRCYCLVNVCYGQWERMRYSFVKDHINEYADSISLLEDDLSKECLLGYLNCKLTEDVGYIFPCVREKASYFSNPFYEISDNEDYVDVGAYTGDTLEEFLYSSNEQYSHIYAFEPEKTAYLKLEKYVKKEEIKNISLFSYGCWKEKTVLQFLENQESSGITNNCGSSQIPVVALDDVLSGKRITVIKINFLYGVYETLVGAKNILMTQKPHLAITVGFDEWALIRIPKLINQLNPDYKLYLRYAAAMPARLILFAC